MDYKEVHKAIKNRIENKKPFLLLRIGDGEYMTMSKNNIEYVAKRQFGYVPPQEQLIKISKMVADAYIYADIIGVPTQHHVNNCGSSWAQAKSYLYKIRPSTKNATTCSIDVHSELLHSGLLDDILQDKEELIYISGRDLDEGLKQKYNIRKIQSFKVSAEQKFQAEKDTVKHYPDQFHKCLSWIEEIDIEGKLCLVGAGILGKIYSSKLKQRGGIVLELGHVFDFWAGKITRGAGKGVNARNNKYKL